MDRFEVAGRRWHGAERPNHLRNAHRHIYEGGHVARRRGTVGGAGTDRNHSGRDDAGRGFSRKIRMGLRRGESFCTLAFVRNSGRFAHIRRPRARVRCSRNSRCCLQPFRARRKLSRRFLRRLSDSRKRKRMGQCDQFRRTEFRIGSRIFHHQWALLD